MLPNAFLVIATKGPLERQAVFSTRDKAREWRVELKEKGYASGIIPMVLDNPDYCKPKELKIENTKAEVSPAS